MPHLVIAGKLHPAGLALLADRDGVTYDYVEEVSEPSYAPLIVKADALVIRTQSLASGESVLSEIAMIATFRLAASSTMLTTSLA